MPRLLLAKSDGTPLLTLDLAHRSFVCIGRSPRCDLAIESPEVSRRHALLFRHPGGWRLADLGSRQGLHTEAGRTLLFDLVEGAWCRIGPAHLWFDPAGSLAWAPRLPDPDEPLLERTPDAFAYGAATLRDARDRLVRRIGLHHRTALLIGADETCDFVVREPGVPPLRAVVYPESRHWAIADAKAGDGGPLLVDGHRARRAHLHGGTVVTIGGHRIVVSGPLPPPEQRGDGADPSEGTDAPDAEAGPRPVSAFLGDTGA